ncbi:MAG: hypothetical protein KKA67_16025 [Spirochaetes bacterium]|nr:hypothetical protein [Spirochaetota bacterium]MBU1079128.1 hypothetical protein [Spirochaetota bacterium]
MMKATANDSVDDRLEELKVMVHDERYMDGAILRIAYLLSDEIMDGIGVSNGGWKQGFKA